MKAGQNYEKTSVNVLLILSVILYFFVNFAAIKIIETYKPNYYLQLLLLLAPQIIAILLPMAAYIVIACKGEKTRIFECVAGIGGIKKSGYKMCLAVIGLAVLSYFGITYLNFGIRGIAQYFTKQVAIKQLPVTHTFLSAIMSVVIIAAVPAFCLQLLNKGVVCRAYADMNEYVSILIVSALSCVLSFNVGDIMLNMLYAIVTLLIYRRTSNVWHCVIFMFVILLPNALTGGGVYLPFDYRSTLSYNESAVNGLFSLSIAMVCIGGAIVLIMRLFSFKRSKSNLKMTFNELVSLVLVALTYVILLLVNYFAL